MSLLSELCDRCDCPVQNMPGMTRMIAVHRNRLASTA